MSPEPFWTPSGVRLRRRTQRPGPLNWLFLPGGPGIGSESLHELVDSAELPGTTWLVDLPGDGSNTDAPGARPTLTRAGHRSCSKPSTPFRIRSTSATPPAECICSALLRSRPG